MDRGISVARFMVIIGLIVQILGLARIIFVQVGLPNMMQGVQRGRSDAIGATIAFLGCLALLYPVLRGRRWAFITTIPVQLLLVLIGTPFFLNEFPRPGIVRFAQWFNIVTVYLAGLVAIVYGVIAALEAFGTMAPVRFRTAEGDFTRRAAVLGAIAFAWLGTVMLAYAVNQVPTAGATLAGPSDEVMRLSAGTMKFQPANLALPAGKATAIFITNTDTLAHSFDIDVLNVHVPVPAGTTVVAMVKPAAGQIEYYCGVPGHKEAGMAGTIAAR